MIGAVFKAKRASMNRPSRKAIREALDTVPIDQVLGVPGELTHKQKTFARLLALGETGAGAYRKAYKATGKPKTVGDNASRLKRDSRIQAEIDAFKAANAAMEYQTPQQLRALVIHSLVKVIADPDAKDATKVQAAKVLGTVTEVAAFTERREVRTIKTSEDARAQLLAKLRQVMTAGAIDVESRDADALLAEIVPRDDAPRADPDPVIESDQAVGETPTPQNGVRSPSLPIHTIPHTQSHHFSNDPLPPAQNSLADLEDELGKQAPL
jgi:hypothetical protein